MKLELLCNDGSPIGLSPPDIYGRGVGGAELAMMSLMETLGKRGHDVTVYNDTKNAGVFSGVRYAALCEYVPDRPSDALIIYRSPNSRVPRRVASKRKVWWSTDQYTVGDFTKVASECDLAVAISDFHKNYLGTQWQIPSEKVRVIDLGVRLPDYEVQVQKIEGRMIFCSIPDRGLVPLLAIWPLIRREYPSATLVITSDYRLWGAPPNNQHHRLAWAGQAGVTFKGKVERRELCLLQQQAELMVYPSTYEELFCLSAAECLVAGALPVTSDIGALATTNVEGIVIKGNPATAEFAGVFAKRVASLLGPERKFLEEKAAQAQRVALRRFDWERIADEWESILWPPGDKGRTSK